ncbi:alpha-amylase family protein [Arachidicoccus terrestris]|uniref:alpha-amylase family protein n=1 Tax=Arachidicoccus terrestris TaxID=2875539 RepID=UPI001CC51A6D|nr:alpha-amylase family protein [Arachidicoccus terrestris]UAY56800.1 alpha-amylase family protein [Arachidicoccus terrestris]
MIRTFRDRHIRKVYLLCIIVITGCAGNIKPEGGPSRAVKGKPVIYQVLVRLFGNRNLTNHYYGSVDENGVGKFNDITGTALDSIKALGITHIWYTGVLEHATMADYSAYHIRPDDPDVVKGRAGSPYAVKDYYDVDPDLAIDVNKRLEEYEALIKRTHDHGLKVIMDFIPNHVARGYRSDKKPNNVVDFGAGDNKQMAFSAQNDFYYLPGTSFQVPAGVNAGGSDFHSLLKDNKFEEIPAKVTGNNVLKPNPSIDDWYETVKLNYGVDLFHGDTTHFDPVPPVWTKMRDILLYWAAKGVDGFRCDVAEMVPLAFWHFVIPAVKEKYPKLLFIAEAYDPAKYNAFVAPGGFDYLYNKVGLYDALKPVMKNDSGATVRQITALLRSQDDISGHMLNFLENHDEERIASKTFTGDPFRGEAAMGVAATATTGPVLVYFGQELGVAADEAEGFGGADGKTTIFDYWGLPVYQKWADRGKYDGAGLNKQQIKLRAFYKGLLNLVGSRRSVAKGKLAILNGRGLGRYGLCYLRYDTSETLFFGANFDHYAALQATAYLPDSIPPGSAKALRPLLSNCNSNRFSLDGNTIEFELPPGGFQVWQIR